MGCSENRIGRYNQLNQESDLQPVQFMQRTALLLDYHKPGKPLKSHMRPCVRRRKEKHDAGIVPQPPPKPPDRNSPAATSPPTTATELSLSAIESLLKKMRLLLDQTAGSLLLTREYHGVEPVFFKMGTFANLRGSAQSDGDFWTQVKGLLVSVW